MRTKNLIGLAALIVSSYSSSAFALQNCIPKSAVPLQNQALPRLKVLGNKIITNTKPSKNFILKGFNFHNNYYMDYSVYPTAACDYANEADVKQIASWGVNSIRLALRWDYFTDENGVFDTKNYQTLGYALIDQYIRWGQKYGVYIILDLHVVPEDQDFGDNSIWGKDSAKQKFGDLWWDIATRYKNNNTIAGYDLFNEPAPASNTDWWSLAQDTVNRIRAAGDQHIIFVEAPASGDSQFGEQPLNGTNLVYSFHTYEPFVISHKGIAALSPIPVPSDYNYPGKVLVDVQWANWAKDTIDIRTKLSSWQTIKSSLIVPNDVGAEFATIKLAAVGKTDTVWFDNISWKQNQVDKVLWNANIETLANATTPLIWSYWGNNAIGQLSTIRKFQGKNSLSISSMADDGFGVWLQGNGLYTNQLLKIKPKDKIDIQAMVYAPKNQGAVSVSVDYLKGIYRNYSQTNLIERLATVKTDMAKYLNWAKQYNVPLYVGEFGAITSPGNSRVNLIQDKLMVFANEGIGWSFWDYKGTGATNGNYFSLNYNNKLDAKLLPIMKAYLKP
jgi:aryl-phospho-beta-D-glucosidase BglC (GH1 family)